MQKCKLLTLTLITIFTVSSCVGVNNNIQQDKTNQSDISSETQKSNPPPLEPPSPIPVSPMPTAVKPPNTSKNTLGSFSTELLDNGKNRVKNISIAAEEIDGYTLQPGEVFSFNDVVGRRSTSKGYKKSKILVNGEVDWGVGGGICQLSSTIYNAVKKAGMTIVERHEHSADVGYVPSGQDATVSYGTLDLKFKNSKDYPIIIDVNVKNNKVYASVVKA